LAQLYQRAGDKTQAEHWLEQAVEESPGDAQPLLAMAHWQLEVRNEPKEAESLVDQAETLEPNSIEIPLLRGIIAWTTGDTSQAEQLLESVVLRQPAHATANLYLATVLAEQDDPQRRQRAFEIVQLQISNKKPTPEMAAASGWVAYHLGEFDRAERELQFAATSPGGGRDAVYYWSRALFRRGKIAQAQQALDRALSTSGLFIHLDEARQWQNELGQPDR
jgi:Tfp pilus assembly protein PilF